MSEMVDKVANALSLSLYGRHLKNNTGDKQYDLTKAARVAIAALREPTKAMVDAALAINHPSCYDADSDDEWRAMIDEALK